MRERPILFSAPMVRAIFEGRKTQTRRVVKGPGGRKIENLRDHDPYAGYSGRYNDPSSWGFPFYDDHADAPLDVWPELCHIGQPGDRLWVREAFAGTSQEDLIYRATVRDDTDWTEDEIHETRWRPSIHMPRWASRIDLEVTGVRVERLQDISEADALAEGVEPEMPDECRMAFERLWESINGPGSWDANPWVWVVEFKRVKP